MERFAVRNYVAIFFAAGLIACQVQQQQQDTVSTACLANSGGLRGSGTTMKISVGCGYTNEPCVSVKICEPGSVTNCTTVDHILLDTGSYGLRLFKTCNGNLNLPPQLDPNVAGNQLGECVSYADFTSDWGPVVTADIYLADQVASSVPMQIIDPSFGGGTPSSCGTSEYAPAASGFNGILGVGLLQTDCPGCASADLGQYYSCNTSGCSHAGTVAAGLQVSNPVSWSHFNGSILTVQSIGPSGATYPTGTLQIGISGALPGNRFAADSNVNFTAFYGASTCAGSNALTSSFFDSGSNFWDFPNDTSPEPNIPTCDDGLYCPGSPGSTMTITAWPANCANTPITFSLIYADSVINNGNNAFNNVGAPYDAAHPGFDFGFPFFFGKSVYNCIQGFSCSGVGGPFWAF